MDDYIFIILAIILSVLAAVKRNKNKKTVREGATPAGPAKKPTIFDQFLDESFFDEVPSSGDQELITAPAPVPASPVQPPKKDSPEPFLSHEPGKKQLTKKTLQVKKKENTRGKVPERKNEGVHDLMNGFSLKKAVIFSEIVRRKY